MLPLRSFFYYTCWEFEKVNLGKLNLIELKYDVEWIKYLKTNSGYIYEFCLTAVLFTWGQG